MRDESYITCGYKGMQNAIKELCWFGKVVRVGSPVRFMTLLALGIG